MRAALRYAVAHRGLVAQWFGVLGPAAAWSVQFLVSYNVADTGSCSPAAPRFLASGPGLKLVVAVVSTVALAVTVAAGAVSYHCWKRLRDQDPTPGRRASWLAVAGMMSSGLFFLLIAGSYLPLVFLPPCKPPV